MWQAQDIQPGTITALLVLNNGTDNQIMFNYDMDSFSARDNLGNSGKISLTNRCVCARGTCYPVPTRTPTREVPCSSWNPCDGGLGGPALGNIPTPTCYQGIGDVVLKPGESLKIDMVLSGLNLIKLQVTDVIVTVAEFSRAKNVSWRMTISH